MVARAAVAGGVIGVSWFVAEFVAAPDEEALGPIQPCRGDILPVLFAARRAIAEENGQWDIVSPVRFAGVTAKTGRLDPLTRFKDADAIDETIADRFRQIGNDLPGQFILEGLPDSITPDSIRERFDDAAREYEARVRGIKQKLLVDNGRDAELAKLDVGAGVGQSWVTLAKLHDLGELLPFETNAEFWTTVKAAFLELNAFAFDCERTWETLGILMLKEIPNAPATFAEALARFAGGTAKAAAKATGAFIREAIVALAVPIVATVGGVIIVDRIRKG